MREPLVYGTYGLSLSCPRGSCSLFGGTAWRHGGTFRTWNISSSNGYQEIALGGFIHLGICFPDQSRCEKGQSQSPQPQTKLPAMAKETAARKYTIYLAIRRMQTKTAPRFFYIKMAIIMKTKQNKQKPNSVEDEGEGNINYPTHREVSSFEEADLKGEQKYKNYH